MSIVMLVPVQVLAPAAARDLANPAPGVATGVLMTERMLDEVVKIVVILQDEEKRLKFVEPRSFVVGGVCYFLFCWFLHQELSQRCHLVWSM